MARGPYYNIDSTNSEKQWRTWNNVVSHVSTMGALDFLFKEIGITLFDNARPAMLDWLALAVGDHWSF
jgi:hypothetical protein